MSIHLSLWELFSLIDTRLTQRTTCTVLGDSRFRKDVGINHGMESTTRGSSTSERGNYELLWSRIFPGDNNSNPRRQAGAFQLDGVTCVNCLLEVN
jgi:hypothetical protein